MTESSQRLIDGLVNDLTPVRPVPRLRLAFSVNFSNCGNFLNSSDGDKYVYIWKDSPKHYIPNYHF